MKDLFVKNYQKLNFNKFKVFNFKNNDVLINELYKQVVEEILLSNPEALEILKNVCIINAELETNINRKCVEACYPLRDIESEINELFDTGIVKQKEGKENTFEFFFKSIPCVLVASDNKECHENAIKYYEQKKKIIKGDINDDVELLFHKANLNPSEDLAIVFFELYKELTPDDYGFQRLINVGEELIRLEEKFRAPILTVLGCIALNLRRLEDSERYYLEALKIYEDLAKIYFKIYLPYIAFIQKSLGNLYIDLKRFEEAEKIYLNALKSYKELKKQYDNTDFHDVAATQNKLDNLKSYENRFEDEEKICLEAVKIYKNIANQYYDLYLPDLPTTEGNLANFYVDLELLEKAEEEGFDILDYTKLFAKICYDEHLNDIAITRTSLGLIYTELGDFEEAERMYIKAIKIRKKLVEQYPGKYSPDLATALSYLGKYYVHVMRFEEAEQYYLEELKIRERLAKEDPEHYLIPFLTAQNNLGNLYSNLMKYQQAVETYLEALKGFKDLAKIYPKLYSSDLAVIQSNLGFIYLHLYNIKRAEPYLKEALKNDPNNADTLFNFACLESLRNNPIKAIEYLTRAIKINNIFINLAKNEERFKKIRDLKEFKELVGS